MNRESIRCQLVQALSRIGAKNWDIRELSTYSSLDVMVRTPCYTALFSVLDEPRASLRAAADDAQRELLSLRTEKGSPWPRDLNLVLMVIGCPSSLDVTAIRELVDDRYMCRKYVLHLNGRAIEEELRELPFLPIRELTGLDSLRTEKRVQDFLSDYNSELVDDLESRSPGAENIVQRILDGVYDTGATASVIHSVPSKHRLPAVKKRLQSVSIQNFRGIKSLQPEAMSLDSDVILIYGPNGVGKTSIVDAIEWAITGRVQRLAPDNPLRARSGPDPIVNLLSPMEKALVCLRFTTGDPVTRRKCDRSTEQTIGSRSVREDRMVIDHVVGSTAPTQESRLRIEQLRDLFCGSHILSQHNIRRFLTQCTSTQRFDVLTNMIGADAFVRFRTKASSVCEGLRAHVRTLDGTLKSLGLELAVRQETLSQRQTSIHDIGQSITSGKALVELLMGIRDALRDSGCKVEVDFLERSSSDDLSDEQLEAAVVQVDTAVSRRKRQNDDLMARLSALEEQQPTYLSAQNQCNSLRADIQSARESLSMARTALEGFNGHHQQIVASLRDRHSRLKTVSARHNELATLSQNFSQCYGYLEKLRTAQTSQDLQGQAMRDAQSAIEQFQVVLNEKRSRLEHVTHRLFSLTQQVHDIDLLSTALPEILHTHERLKHYNDREGRLRTALRELLQQAETKRDTLALAKTRLFDLNALYETESRKHETVKSLIAKLSEFVASPECPLCGRNFESTLHAVETIGKHLASFPHELKDLARQLDEANSTVLQLQNQLDAIEEQQQSAESELQQLVNYRSTAMRDMNEFTGKAVAIGVQLDKEDPSIWHEVVRSERARCDSTGLESERDSLESQIKLLLSQIANGRDKLSAATHQLEEERAGLHNVTQVLQKLSIEMVGSSDSRARALACYTLGQLAAQDAAPLLARAIQDEDTAVRASAAFALGRINAAPAAAALARALNDPDEFVRKIVASASGNAPQASITSPAWQTLRMQIEAAGHVALQEIGHQLDESAMHMSNLKAESTQLEEEEKSAESSITSQRETIRNLEEDIASKEAQLHAYERTCSRFAADCVALAIDSAHTEKDLSRRKSEISLSNIVLNTIKDQNHILQQMVSLRRVQVEVENLRAEVDDFTARVQGCSRSRDGLQRWVNRLERLKNDIVKKQVDVVGSHLQSLEPMTRLLYRRLGPHPLFANIKIEINERERELNFQAESDLNAIRGEERSIPPESFFSDAQINSLAIVVFLAGALRQRWSGFETIFIDDPIQQMDDMNVYALIDLVRGLANHRQFVLFTCNRDFYLLGLERFECLNRTKPRSFKGYQLSGIAPAELRVQCDVQ